jgi:4-diphosphocytidyl-2-C-methyl-D-erythritol kinase
MTTAAEAERAPAKINLALHVTGRREDGYHLLHSLVVFADFGDDLSVEPAESLSLRVSGPCAEGVPTDGSNLVLRAAEALRTARGVDKGAALHLEKHLPHGAGLGGGSSDAAAAIRLLARFWGVEPLSSEEALPLGADVPVCLCAPEATLLSGIGEVLTPAPKMPEGWLVLANPGVVVPTAQVFAHFDAHFECDPKGLDPSKDFASIDDFEGWLFDQRNDLTPAAASDAVAPVINDVLEAFLALPGCLNSDMSGSGSTCWGLFGTEAAATTAAERLARRHPGWWVRSTRL